MRRALVVLALLIADYGAALGQWTEAPARGWIQASTYFHRTSRRFDERGQIKPLFNEGGQSTTTSVFLTGAIGALTGVDVWVEIPIHRLRFDDVVAERTSAGIGDPRLHLRIGHDVTGVDLGSWAVALRGGVKLRGGSFPIDAEIIPLTDGQIDYEVFLELGHSFWPFPAYMSLWTGYRWRTENEPIRRRPGNELALHVIAGGAVRNWTWKISVEALKGRSPELFSIEVRSARRELVQLLPAVGHSIGPGVLEAGVRVPLTGRNLPTGPAVFIGYFSRFDLAALWR